MLLGNEAFDMTSNRKALQLLDSLCMSMRMIWSMNVMSGSTIVIIEQPISAQLSTHATSQIASAVV